MGYKWFGVGFHRFQRSISQTTLEKNYVTNVIYSVSKLIYLFMYFGISTLFKDKGSPKYLAEC